MLQLARKHVLGWATSAALTLAMVEFFTPAFADIIIDLLMVALVFVSAKLAKTA